MNLTHKHVLYTQVNHWDARCIIRHREKEGRRGRKWIDWMEMGGENRDMKTMTEMGGHKGLKKWSVKTIREV